MKRFPLRAKYSSLYKNTKYASPWPYAPHNDVSVKDGSHILL